MIKTYFAKWKGISKAPPRVGKLEVELAFLGSSLAMLAIAWLHARLEAAYSLPLLMAPFGASAVLLFGAFRSLLAQPRNIIGGHVLSCLVGVSAHALFPADPVWAVALAVPAAIALMHLLSVLHPPGGATALLTATGGAGSLGYWYALTPCLAGSLIMVLVALIVNNIPKSQRYPQYW